MLEIETQAIIWDLDGTLIDSLELSWEIIQKIFPMKGHKVPEFEELARNFHGTLDDTLSALLGTDDSEKIEAMVADFLVTQDEVYRQAEQLFLPDAVRLAQQAHELGIWQMLVTNRAHNGRGIASPKALVANSELAKIMSHIICGDEVSFRKPDVRVLDAATVERELPEKCVIIGDQFVDAQLAQNLGAAAILVQRHEEIPHIDKLDDWQSWVHVVPTLDDVRLVTNKDK